MTPTDDRATKLSVPGPSHSLQHILDPVTTGSFFADYFEAKPLHINRNRPEFFGDLCSLDDVDYVLTTLHLTYPDVRAVAADRLIEAREYCNSVEAIDVDRLLRLYADGATIILNHLQLLHPRLSEFCAALEGSFDAPLQTNIYLTPASAKGFKAHFDTHDVLILQVAGEKAWTLYQTAIELPLQGQAEEVLPDTPTAEFQLKAGDVLYIPRGLVHDARSMGERSLHITVGILSYTWSDVILEAVAEAITKDVTYRRALTRGLVLTGATDGAVERSFRQMISSLVERVDFKSALETFSSDFIEARRPRLRGQLSMLDALEHLSPDGFVSMRPHLAFSLHEDAEAIHIRCYGKDISIPAQVASAVRYALGNTRFCIRDLPSDMDEDSKLVLVRRLVKEGILTIEGERRKSENIHN